MCENCRAVCTKCFAYLRLAILPPEAGRRKLKDRMGFFLAFSFEWNNGGRKQKRFM